LKKELGMKEQEVVARKKEVGDLPIKKGELLVELERELRTRLCHHALEEEVYLTKRIDARNGVTETEEGTEYITPIVASVFPAWSYVVLKEAAFNPFSKIETDYNGFAANAALAFLVGTSLYSHKR